MMKKFKTYIVATLSVAIILILKGCFLPPECGMSDGPCRGKSIDLNIDTIQLDKLIEIPGGIIAIANMNTSEPDTIAPILLRLDDKKEVVWAISLDTKISGCQIQLFSMSSINLVHDNYRNQIDFFNESYREPGVIYLKDNFEFDYICLSSM